MLILTRRVGEKVMIGDNVTVAIIGVKGNQIRIGIRAPKDVTVHRQEIYERIRDASIAGVYGSRSHRSRSASLQSIPGAASSVGSALRDEHESSRARKLPK